ncbi:MAG: flagellar motor switch protein FliN [Spirochaetota bacterium]
MGEGSLSQDEIDALLLGADDSPFDNNGGDSAGSSIVPAMSQKDKELLSDIYGNGFNIAASTLSAVLSKGVKFSAIQTEALKPNELKGEIGDNLVCFSGKLLGQSLSGDFVTLLQVDSASKIVSIMMGGMSQGGLDASQMNTLRNVIDPLLSSVTAQLQQRLGIIVTNSATEAKMAASANDVSLPDGGQLVRVSANLDIDGIPTVKLRYIIVLKTAEDIVSLARKSPAQQPAQQMEVQGAMTMQPDGGISVNPGVQQQQPAVGIKSVGFPSLSTAGNPQGGGNLNLLMDVQMALTVELGRTKMYIKDILGLGEGSIIELDKLAGEPVDLLVNGKLIAKGEVVVIDENFGVRVTDIVSPTDRIKTEGK